MPRLLAGYGDDDFENIFVSNVFQLNDDNSLDDYSFEVDSNSNMIISKGATELLTLTSTGDLSTIGTIETTKIADVDDTTSITTDSETLKFTTNSVERARIDSSGNFGINNTNPSNKLSIIETSSGSTTNPFKIINASSTTNTAVAIDFSTASSESTTARITSKNTGSSKRNLIFSTYTGTGITEAMTLSGDGDVDMIGNLSINNTQVLSSTTLGSGVVNSSLTNLGTLTSLNLEGDFTINRANTSQEANIQLTTASSLNWLIGLDDSPSGISSDFVIKQTDDGAPEFVIETGGYVGIGVSQPENKLHIKGNSGNLGWKDNSILIESSDTEGETVIAFRNGDGDNGFAIGFNGNNSQLGIFQGDTTSNSLISGGNTRLTIDDTGEVNIRDKLQVDSTGTPVISLAIGQPDTGFEAIATDKIGVYRNNDEIFRFFESGRTLDQWGPLFDANPCMHIKKEAIGTTNNEFIEFYIDASDITGGTSVGILELNSSGNLALTTTSDERLKENINEYEGGVAKIKKLRAVTFNWKEEKRAEIGEVAGFIAQEVDEAGFKNVNKNNPDIWRISYIEFIPFLWSGTRELINRVEDLEEEKDLLQTRVDNLEIDKDLLQNRVEELENSLLDITSRLDLLENT